MAKPPNILFVFTDQQSGRALGAAGNAHVRTPHMDALAGGGVLFAESYCTSPVCSPARASLVTSRMPHEVGVEVNDLPLAPGFATMGGIFRAAGYETAWAGKWHIPEPYPVGRDAIPGFENLAFPRPEWIGLGACADDPVTDAAVAFLRRRHSRPFLLAVSLHNPHDICHWIVDRRRDVIGLTLDPKLDPPLPENLEPPPCEPEFIVRCRQRDHYGAELRRTEDWSTAEWRRYLNAYYRLVEHADKRLGRILAALAEAGLENNTIVLFTSDHGEGLAEHRWVVKLMLYESAATVPMILRFPGRLPAGVVDRRHLVSGLDVLPTLCDYAGVDVPEDIRGESVRAVIDDPHLSGREFVVVELQPDPQTPAMKGRMIRSARYKYVVFSEGARREMLFDLRDDPGETRNLAPEPAHHKTLAAYRAALGRWLDRTDDDFPREALLRT